MILDVIVPTYNRSRLVARTLESLREAVVPDGHEVRVTVVDNNSTDDTPATVAAFGSSHRVRVDYQQERIQGRSAALNRGIGVTYGQLVATIDDDETVPSDWFLQIFRAMDDPSIDFVGGRVLPESPVALPHWLPDGYGGVIGFVDGGDVAAEFGRDYQGMLSGGNAVFRRSVLERVGRYAVDLGRTDRGLLTGEDQDLYERLLTMGARGMYEPELVVYHHVPMERLTKAYYRRWCYWRGVSLGRLDKRRTEPVPYLFGAPRYQVGRAARSFGRLLGGVIRRTPANERFADELAIIDLIGFWRGKYSPSGRTVSDGPGRGREKSLGHQVRCPEGAIPPLEPRMRTER